MYVYGIADSVCKVYFDIHTTAFNATAVKSKSSCDLSLLLNYKKSPFALTPPAALLPELKLSVQVLLTKKVWSLFFLFAPGL